MNVWHKRQTKCRTLYLSVVNHKAACKTPTITVQILTDYSKLKKRKVKCTLVLIQLWIESVKLILKYLIRRNYLE